MEFLLHHFKDVFENTFPNTVKYTHTTDGEVILQFVNMPNDFYKMLRGLYYIDNNARHYIVKFHSDTCDIYINRNNFGKILDAITTPCRDYAITNFKNK